MAINGDLRQIKHLYGNGQLYVRLNVSKDTLVCEDNDYDQTDSVEHNQKGRDLEINSRAEIQPLQSEV